MVWYMYGIKWYGMVRGRVGFGWVFHLSSHVRSCYHSIITVLPLTFVVLAT